MKQGLGYILFYIALTKGKKMKTKLLVLLIISPMILSGCDIRGDSPSTWDIEVDTKWVVYREGEIEKFAIKRAPYCDKPTKCPLDCLKHGSYRYIQLCEMGPMRIGQIRNPGGIKIGSIGKLYKYDTRGSDETAWFQWVEQKKPKEEKLQTVVTTKKEQNNITIEEKDKSITITTKKKEEKIENDWRRADNLADLNKKIVVLIVLNDGIITTGFITHDEQWKLGLNINKYKYGKTLTNVSKWKRLELE
jgi:hypothetical protein